MPDHKIKIEKEKQPIMIDEIAVELGVSWQNSKNSFIRVISGGKN